MSKTSGLGQTALYNALDISGDVTAIGSIHGGPVLLDDTGIDKSAHERIGGIRDGGLDFMSWFNPSIGASFQSLKLLPSDDVYLLLLTSSTLGEPICCFIAKQVNYDGTLGTDRSFTFAVSTVGGLGFGLEWGVLLTAGKRTDTAATNGTAVQNASGLPAAVTVTSASAATPTVVLTGAAHGLVTGDTVQITGASQGALNAHWTVTVTDATHFTVPLDLTGGASTGGSMVKTSTDFGWAAYLAILAFTGTDATIKLQHSSDNVTFADVTGGSFVATATGPTNANQRIAGAATAQLREYVRASTTTVGGITSLQFVVGLVRYQTSQT